MAIFNTRRISATKGRISAPKGIEAFLLALLVPLIVANAFGISFMGNVKNIATELFAIVRNIGEGIFNIGLFALSIAITPIFWLGVGGYLAGKEIISFIGSCCRPKASEEASIDKINQSKEHLTEHKLDTPEKSQTKIYAEIADLVTKNLKQEHNIQFAFLPLGKYSLTERKCKEAIEKLLNEYISEEEFEFEIMPNLNNIDELKSFVSELGKELANSHAIESKILHSNETKNAIKEVIEARRASNKATLNAESAANPNLNTGEVLVETIGDKGKQSSPFVDRIRNTSAETLRTQVQEGAASRASAVQNQQAVAAASANYRS